MCSHFLILGADRTDMHTRHTFGVTDEELRVYMRTWPFVLPHFLVGKSATMLAASWNPKCWSEVSRVLLVCIPPCVCNHNRSATFLPTGSRCLANTLFGFPHQSSSVPNPVCTAIGQNRMQLPAILGQSSQHSCVCIHSQLLSRRKLNSQFYCNIHVHCLGSNSH